METAAEDSHACSASPVGSTANGLPVIGLLALLWIARRRRPIVPLS